MGIEAPEEEVKEEIEEKPLKETKLSTGQAKMKRPKKLRELKIKTEPLESEIKVKEEAEKIEISQAIIQEKVLEEEVKKPEEPRRKSGRAEGGLESFAKATDGKEKWFEPEGELAIDVYQTETDLVIQSAIAGVRPEFLDISIERDIITIKGVREKPFEESGDYFTQECYWGPFSREVILPVEVDPDRAEATMREGILTIRIPKILREKKRIIKVKA